MRRDAEILLKATIKPRRDAFHFHLQRGADASILYFWISLSKERVCIREFKINSEDIRCISSPEDASLSIPQKYQRVFDLTADVSPSETNRHGRRLRYIFSFSVQLLVAVLMRKCCNLFSPPPPLSGALDSSPPHRFRCSLLSGLVRGSDSESGAARGRRASWK